MTMNFFRRPEFRYFCNSFEWFFWKNVKSIIFFKNTSNPRLNYLKPVIELIPPIDSKNRRLWIWLSSACIFFSCILNYKLRTKINNVYSSFLRIKYFVPQFWIFGPFPLNIHVYNIFLQNFKNKWPK